MRGRGGVLLAAVEGDWEWARQVGRGEWEGGGVFQAEEGASSRQGGEVLPGQVSER